MKKCNRLTVCVALLAALAMGIESVHAQTNSVASGNWTSTGTWSAGVPTGSLPAAINGGHTVTINSSGELTNLVDVGSIASQTGTLNITGGDLTVFDEDSVSTPNSTTMRLGTVAGATGNLTMSGGQVFISEDQVDVFDDGDLTVGDNGTGSATISGGTMTVADEVFIAQEAGSVGTLSVSGTGIVNVSGRNLLVGFGGANAETDLPGGQGEVNVSGTGQLNVTDTIFMGFGGANTAEGLAGSYGELNVSNSAQVAVSGWLQSGFGAGSTSLITQSGGTVNVSGLLVHGARGTATFDHTGGAFSANLIIIGDGVDNNLAHATYNISGSASISSNIIFWIGAWGKAQGIVNQDGGTVNAGALTVGRDGSGEYNMSAGILNMNGTDGYAGNNHLIVGQVGNADENIAKGAGVFEQTGGTVTVKTGVFLGDFDHSEGTYKISGGSLTVGGGSHPNNPEGIEDFIGDFSVGGALASNALVARIEPANANDPQGQALATKGTFIVSGSAATINIAGNFLANPTDKSALRRDEIVGEPLRANSATLGFEIFNSTGTSLINVGGVADLDGAVIDLDLMGGYNPAINTTFDLLRADTFGATGSGITQNVGTGKGFTLAAEDAGAFSLAVVTSGTFEILRATFLGAVGTPGDFNGDGKVNGRDFLIWQRGGSPNPKSAGDLTLWQNNYGAGGLAAVAAVPEPTSLVLLSVVGLFASACRVRGQRA